MKRFPALVLCFTIWSIAPASSVHAFHCNTCHSKNPAQVRMHMATRAKEIDCFDCHKATDKLLGKAPLKDRGALLSRRATELPCLECHQK
jgi:hypothetical protein